MNKDCYIADVKLTVTRRVVFTTKISLQKMAFIKGKFKESKTIGILRTVDFLSVQNCCEHHLLVVTTDFV